MIEISLGPLSLVISYFLNYTLKPDNTELFELQKQKQAEIQTLHRNCFAFRVLSFKQAIENASILVDV